MTNILNDVFALTKEIKADAKRKSIKQAFIELHKSKLTGGSIGYQGSQLHKQFLGYLAIYRDRERINKESIIKIEDVPNETIELFTYGHSMLKGLNQLCLRPLLNMIPSSSEIIDPFWIMENGKTFSSEIDLSNPSINSLVQNFQLGKPFRIIKNRLQHAPQLKKLKGQDVANATYSIIENIKKSGLKNSPKHIFDVCIKANSPTAESALSAIILSMIHLHSSLQVIDQILFQSFISDKIICLDESNIYNISNMGSNVIGEVLEVITTEVVHKLGEVIIIDLPYEDMPNPKKFCMVEQIEMKFSQDFGNEFIVGARCVDDTASKYPNLIKKIELI